MCLTLAIGRVGKLRGGKREVKSTNILLLHESRPSNPVIVVTRKIGPPQKVKTEFVNASKDLFRRSQGRYSVNQE